MAYVFGAVLAAGRGLRMGGPKAALVLNGERLVDRAIAALTVSGCDRVIAVIAAGVTVDGALPVVNSAPERGMRSSLALAVESSFAVHPEIAGAGIASLPAEPRSTEVGLAVVLVDMPGIDAAAVRAVVEHWRSNPRRIAVGRFEDGRRGHPTVMALARWQQSLLLAESDEGARRYLSVNGDLIDEILVDGDPADLDSAEDLRAWRERH